MRNWNLILIFCGILTTSFGQVAIVQDVDGYSNVRSERNPKSKVVHKLKTDVAFFYTEEYENKTLEWIKILIPKNEFSFDCPSKYLEGFIHRSRIKPLEQLPKFKEDDFSFNLITKPFEKKGKIIDYIDEKYVFAINGLPPIGVDGNIPKLEIKRIDINLNGKKIDVSPALIMDIFECTDNSIVYKVDKTFFVHLSCSDGAGFYELVWVITENGIKQRLIGSIN